MEPTETESFQEGQLVVFRLEDQYYGIPIGSVQEIIVLDRVTRLPQMPDFVEGIIDLRGRIIPVVNLRKRFGLLHQTEQGVRRTVVAEIGELEAGLLVDDVTGVMQVAAGTVQPPSDLFAVGAAVVSGIVRTDDRLVVILRPDRILKPCEQELLPTEGLALTAAGG